MMSIPVLSTFPMEKQRLYTVATLDALIHQRKALSAKCERTLNIIRTAKQSAEIAPHSTEVREGLNTQSSLLAELNDGILWQGKTISIFTCISIVFLPLGFFSQYFALNFEDTAGTAGTGGTPTFNRFWLITGSTTASIAFIMLCFLIDSRYPFRQFLRGLFTLQPNCPTTMVWPLRKQVAQEQRHYLKRLPKYYMEVITAAEANQKRFLEAPTIDTPLTRTSSSDVKLKTCTRDGTKAVVRYDDASGKIFFDQIDRYDYLYRVSVGGANDAGNHHLYWKKTRSEHEETIYRYRPRFTLKATSTASASPNPYTPTELEYLQWSYPTHGSIMDDQPQNPWTCPWWHHESQGVSTVSDFIKLTTELAVPAATQATTTEQAPTCRLRLAPVVQ
ncbi:hypothetical protein FN846DRAFT_980355 [Sphaerosporella brunnea]|uniref:Uncharacterized protein n=1 Tax=Sphaerosporella brunnea TaxID=1250544 RepID=A0A5J5EDK8_9PEZI|nr:hypothetical protein FN846DRAFT_980355 [Sphaerosporella brunnea]